MSDEPRKRETRMDWELEIPWAPILLIVLVICATAVVIVYLVVTSGGA